MSDEWVSVKDRLPGTSADFIVWNGEEIGVGNYDPSFMDADRWWAGDDYHARAITHWMPLPEPPKS
jgi:hypothetical protein